MSFLTIINQMLHITLITILSNNSLVPQFLLQIFDLIFFHFLDHLKPSLSNQNILFIFMIVVRGVLDL